jgi:hypothetical protein
MFKTRTIRGRKIPRTHSDSFHRYHARPQVELLEDRMAPAVLTVNSTGDTVSGTTATLDLREAILLVNSGGTATDSFSNSLAVAKSGQIDTSSGGFGSNDTILFNIPTSDPGYTAPTSVTISNVSLSNNVATLTTSGQVLVALGQTVIVAGLSNTIFNGYFQVSAVTATSFSCTLVHADVASMPDSGTASTPPRFTIMPSSALPQITTPVIIKGFSQPGSSANNMPNQGLGSGDNASRLITLDGRLLPVDHSGPYVGTTGLTISAGHSTVSGLVIQNFTTDISLTTSGADTIQGNFITGATGYYFIPGYIISGFGVGISVDNVPDNLLGGSSPADRDIFGSNDEGIVISGVGASGNQVQGNYIGAARGA